MRRSIGCLFLVVGLGIMFFAPAATRLYSNPLILSLALLFVGALVFVVGALARNELDGAGNVIAALVGLAVWNLAQGSSGTHDLVAFGGSLAAALVVALLWPLVEKNLTSRRGGH
jgi:hypothetical protein